MTFENRCDLLEYLANTSHQLKGLLNDQELAHFEDHQFNPRQQIQHRFTNDLYRLPDESNQSRIIAYVDAAHHQGQGSQQTFGLVESQESSSFYTLPQAGLERGNLIAADPFGYAAHFLPPSSTNNYTNVTQYSAKQVQRQDTGYVYPDESIQFPPTIMAPPQQEFQPECAYCCWLATTTSFTCNNPTTSTSAPYQHPL